MARPVEKKYIHAMEDKLNFKFPVEYSESMENENGGTVSSDYDDWDLFPIEDGSDIKSVAKTCNNVYRETLMSRKWVGFPENAIAIGANGSGDKLILFKDDNRIYCWLHETREVEVVAESFSELERVF